MRILIGAKHNPIIASCKSFLSRATCSQSDFLPPKNPKTSWCLNFIFAKCFNCLSVLTNNEWLLECSSFISFQLILLMANHSKVPIKVLISVFLKYPASLWMKLREKIIDLATNDDILSDIPLCKHWRTHHVEVILHTLLYQWIRSKHWNT
jgi:hypothetical protein